MGRPRIQIDKRMFEEMCGLFCTLKEMCAILGVSEDTVQRWCKRTYKRGFREVYAEKSAMGRMSLRRSQLRLAETNPAMAIFLGKNYLGQTDQQRVEVTRADDESSVYIENYFASKNDEG